MRAMNGFEEAHEKHGNGPARNVTDTHIGKGPDFSPFSNLRQDIGIDDTAVLIYKTKNANGINLSWLMFEMGQFRETILCFLLDDLKQVPRYKSI